jgi:hypothetical protein
VPETGSYGCVDIPDIMGWFIRRLTHSKYSHAFIVLDGTPGKEIILEARPSGSKIKSLSEYHGDQMVFSKDHIDASPEDLIDYAARHYLDIPYGFDDILLLGLVESVGMEDVPQFMVNHVLSEKRQICSQMVAQFGADYGMDWLCGKPDPQLVVPGDLAERATSG